MEKNGCKVKFGQDGCDIYNREDKIACSAKLVNNLYLLNTHREVIVNLTTTDNVMMLSCGIGAWDI